MRYKVKKQLNMWLKENGFGDIKAYNNEDFEAQENLIGINNRYGKEALKSIVELVNQLGGIDYKVKIATVYTLHELGHTQTNDEFSEIAQLAYIVINKMFELIIKISKNKLYQPINYLYQRLPQEKRATQWAVEYINENKKAIKDLEKILEKI